MSSSQPPLAPDPEDPARRTATGVLEQVETETEVQPGDHERFAHYVRKDRITASAISGQPVIALCGKVWTPTRDPSRFPVCPACKAIYESLGAGDDASGS